ncbi:MAG: hypothetical protein AB7L91_00080 [Dehalococcoidia bacterium]
MTRRSASRAPRSLPRRGFLRLGARGVALGTLLLAGCGRDEDDSGLPLSASPVPSLPVPQRPSPSPPPTMTPSPTPSATSTPTPRADVRLPDGPDEPNEITLEPIADPPQDQLVLVEYAAKLARDSFYRRLGFYLDGPVSINVVNVPELPVHAAAFLREGAEISSITVNVGQATWAIETPLDRTKVVAHEYFHVVQNWLRGGTDTSDEPLFLVEGSAEYAGYLATVDGGMLRGTELRTHLLQRLRRQRILLPALDRLLDHGPLALTGYTLAALAVERLVGLAGLDPIARYTMLVADRAPPDAFEAVFGRSLQAFYGDFAVWRRSVGI